MAEAQKIDTVCVSVLSPFPPFLNLGFIYCAFSKCRLLRSSVPFQCFSLFGLFRFSNFRVFIHFSHFSSFQIFAFRVFVNFSNFSSFQIFPFSGFRSFFVFFGFSDFRVFPGSGDQIGTYRFQIFAFSGASSGNASF